MTNKKQKRIILTFDSNKEATENTIFVSTLEEFKIFLSILGAEATLESEIYPEEVRNWIRGRKFDELLIDIKDIKIMPIQKQLILSCFEKITDISDKAVNRTVIEKSRVHKTFQEDVLIQEIEDFNCSQIESYIGTPQSTREIHLDHSHEDHIEAILLTEFCRQSALASITKKQNFETDFYILEEFKKYIHFIKREREIVVQVYYTSSRIGIGLCVFTVFQDETLCMSGYFFGTGKRV